MADKNKPAAPAAQVTGSTKPTSPTAQVAGSTKPGAPAPEAAKAPKRAAHPLVGNKDAKVYPFKAVPKDFDTSKHLPLKGKDFGDRATFFDYRADQMQRVTDAMRKRAEQERSLGNVAERAKARHLVKMQEKMAQLRKELEAQGIDVDSLLKSGAAEAETK